MLKQDAALFAEDLTRSEPGQPPNLAYLIAAAVVLDSYYFKEDLRGKKWTEEDTVAHEFLMQHADVGHDYWQPLNHAKFDVEAGLDLGLHGIFIRDFKQYELASGLMGVSVSTGVIDKLVERFGAAGLGEACRSYLLSKKLGLFVIIAIQASDDGNIEKNLMVFQLDDNPVEQALKTKGAALCSLCEGTEDMQLHNKRVLTAEQLGVPGTITYYTIGNNRYSRKAFEAIVKTDSVW